MTIDELQTTPCPWCRAQPYMAINEELGRKLFQLKCKNANCLVRPSTDWLASKKALIKGWNKRIPLEVSALEASHDR